MLTSKCLRKFKPNNPSIIELPVNAVPNNSKPPDFISDNCIAFILCFNMGDIDPTRKCLIVAIEECKRRIISSDKPRCRFKTSKP